VTTDQAWLINDEVIISDLQEVWNHVYGRRVPLKIKRGTVSHAMTTPTCHLTLPLASASLPIFFLHAPHPFYTFLHPFYIFLHPFCHFPPTTVLPQPFQPFSCISATFPHHFRFGTCFLHLSTLPTLYFIFIEPSDHFH